MCKGKAHLVAWRNPNETFPHFEVIRLKSDPTEEDCFIVVFRSNFHFENPPCLSWTTWRPLTLLLMPARVMRSPVRREWFISGRLYKRLLMHFPLMIKDIKKHGIHIFNLFMLRLLTFSIFLRIQQRNGRKTLTTVQVKNSSSKKST